jgi:hypothetical protein
LIFTPVKNAQPALGFGIGTFNATLATIWSPMTDLLFATRFSEFLIDPTRSIDITSGAKRSACESAFNGKAGHICDRTYYVPGGIENVVAWLLSGAAEETADAFVAENQQGYMFDFIYDGNDNQSFDYTKDCKMFGVTIGAFAICIKNLSPNQVYMSLCPVVAYGLNRKELTLLRTGVV